MILWAGIVPVAEAGTGGRIDREVLVKFNEEFPSQQARGSHRQMGVTDVKRLRYRNLDRVRVPGHLTLKQTLERYQADPRVEYAEPNYIMDLYGVPDDPAFDPYQWNMRNTGQVVMGTTGIPHCDIDAPPAWDVSTGSPDVVIAVIDTGVDYTHPDLSGNIWVNPLEVPGNGVDDDLNGYVDDVHGIDIYNDDSDPMDDNGHGTHVAGIIGARGNDGTGVAGIAWNVKIMVCKFTDALGQGTLADVTECLDYVRAMKNRGVNVVATSNSYGLLLTEPLQTLHEAIQDQQDILFVAAAGNNAYDGMGEFHNYPSDYSLPNIISVSSSDNRDRLAGISNYGHDVHISAPGVGIYSSFSGKDYYGNPLNYKTMSGTSMAAPHVAGVAALVAGALPEVPWWEIRNLILAGAEEVPALAGLTATGRRLSAFGALSCTARPVLAPWQVSTVNGNDASGIPVVLSALSTTCAEALGPVNVTVSNGDVVEPLDDGIWPDVMAGDGIFTAEWTPSTPFCTMTFSSPAGEHTVSGRDPAFLVSAEYLESGRNLVVHVRTCTDMFLPPVVEGYGEMSWDPVTGLWVFDSGKQKPKDFPVTVTVRHDTGTITGPVVFVSRK